MEHSMNKEITVFTEGDATLASTWSNIPYFLTATLEEKGYTVHRINISDTGFLQRFYDKFLCRILRHTFFPHTTFRYSRSIFFTRKIQKQLKEALAKYPQSDYYLSTSFSFSPKNYTDKPCILFCDWSYEYLITHFNQRQPDCLEKAAVRRQDALIRKADYVFALFPDVAQHMQAYYKNTNIAYLGNVINSELTKEKPDFARKLAGQKILFIGLKKYREGVEALIQSAKLLHPVYPALELNIVGMTASDCSDTSDVASYIHFHGYLSKDQPDEKALYDALLQDSLVYVNTTPVWAGFSSALESLYHYLPVITSPYQSFTDTFSDTIDFGYYCKENSPAQISKLLQHVLQLSPDDYETLCQNAHAATLDYTWSSYVDKMMQVIQENC